MKQNDVYQRAARRIELAQFRGDKTLDLRRMNLTSVPESLGNLPQLQALDLSENELTTLPESLGQLTKLRTLDVSLNQLQALSESLGQLTQLHTLDLGSNRLTAMPESLGNLTRLHTLILSRNQITTLPESIDRLTQLQILDLKENRLATLPESLALLTQLQMLILHSNQLTELPESFRKLKNLEHLFLHDNPGLGMPPEILGPAWMEVHKLPIKPASPQSILDYYFRTRTERTQSLNEAKMLLLGQGGVGKTSLAHYLVHGKKCNPTELPTEGINIADWSVQGRKGQNGAFEKIDVHIWDFGGQEIMHATHQFFLTRRSLYLLVIDARAGEKESNIHYWLKIIGSYAGDSPVLVVINKCDQQLHDLNETALRRDYPSIRGFIQTSCTTGEGIAELKRTIKKLIHRLPHVFDKLPQSYFAVKQELTQDASKKNYIPIEEYHRICERHNVKEEEHKNDLIRFLHDLGVVLNFQDPKDPHCINDPFVLNPKWVTEGVYAIVNNKPLKAQKDGILTYATLADLLNVLEGYAANHHDFIVRKMIQFELAYELYRIGRAGQRWLIPELLDPNEPAKLGWKPEESLNFQYAYPVLPAGVICRFIVRMQHHVHREKSWRSGTVLEIGGNRVLVRGDLDKNRVFIAVQGEIAKRRECLAIVRDAFHYIHGTIPELKPKEEIPLPNNPDIAVGYEHLLKLEKHGEQQHFPEGADHPYAVQDLLNGVDSNVYRVRRRGHTIKEREMMDKKHVFISYCHDNKEEVARLVEDLEKTGESVWWDEDILVGRDWKDAIREAMRNAYAVVICLSSELNNRYQSGVYPEIRDAIAAFRQYAPGHAFIFPVKLDDCKIPPIEIDDTRTLDRLQCIDLFPEKKRPAAIQKLLASLATAPGHA